ncbi:MAG: DUF1524 domain-containing protein [Nannocystaceae bacterium]
MVGRALRRSIRRWRRRLRTALWLAAAVGTVWWLATRAGVSLPGGPSDDASPEPGPAEPYDRGSWSHWVDVDGDCQDTRQEVLIAESEIPVRFRGGGRCKVASGRWRCPYTGRVITDPRRLDVDHLVPLHEAHRSGGDRWSRPRRERYANELDDADHLVAVEAGANRSKGDKAPDAWMPADPDGRCQYLRQWLSVKRRWSLRLRDEERRFIERGLQRCDRGQVPERPAR